MMSLLFAAVSIVGSTDGKVFADWGFQTLEAIRRELPSDGKLLGEEASPGEKPKQAAFDWSVGVTLSALNAAAHINPSYRGWLHEYVEATRVYWNTEGPVPGYDVLPTPKSADRYYDDNQWMAMTLVEAYENLGDRKYLDWAEQTMQFVLSGEDSKWGGGIYWKENGKTSKNTCSNAPAASALLALYRHDKKDSYLDEAKKLYAWTKSNLQDPEDHLMWDALGEHGVEKTKWTYNTGLMIRASSELYRVTGEKVYLDDAEVMADSSLAHWIDSDTGAFKDDGKFAHLLMESWKILDRNAPSREHAKFRDAAAKALRYVHDKTRDELGHYGHRWDRIPTAPYVTYHLIDQAAAARAFLELADWLK